MSKKMAQHDDYSAMADAITRPIITGPQGIGTIMQVNGDKVTFEKNGVSKVYTINPARKAKFMSEIHLFDTPGLKMNNDIFLETNVGSFSGTMKHTAKTNNPRLNSPEPEDEHIGLDAQIGSVESIQEDRDNT